MILFGCILRVWANVGFGGNMLTCLIFLWIRLSQYHLIIVLQFTIVYIPIYTGKLLPD